MPASITAVVHSGQVLAQIMLVQVTECWRDTLSKMYQVYSNALFATKAGRLHKYLRMVTGLLVALLICALYSVPTLECWVKAQPINQ